MAEILLKYYKYVCDEVGFNERLNLAKLTQIPSTLAATKPDNSENIEKFKKAVSKITGKPAPVFS